MINYSVSLPDFKIYIVGGSVRDHLMGVESQDIDFVCETSFQEMDQWITQTHKKVFLAKPEFLTIRAFSHDNQVYDYVVARKDSTYLDGRHPDSVEPGSIVEDLARRDFTVNAIAYNLRTKELYDPFHGQQDLKDKILKCVGSTQARFKEDPLRIIRAMRFAITKGFQLDFEIQQIFQESGWAELIIKTVSENRLREELRKCFVRHTVPTMEFLIQLAHPEYRNLLFANQIWLEPTNKSRS